MPELPDLQVFSKNLDKKFSGKRVRKFSLSNKKSSKSPEKKIKDSIEGEVVKKVYREGKQLFFEFKNGDILGLHLMLHGDLYIEEEGSQLKNTIFEMEFENGKVLVLTDWQGAANVQLNPEIYDSPDALSDDLDIYYLKEKLNSRGIVKNILLDQKIIRGIGNAYADEILWEAKIHPFSVAGKIPEKKIAALLKAIKKVLTTAGKHILKNHPDIIKGEVRDFLKIHNAKKKESPNGTQIEIETKGGRKTYFTAEQQLFLAVCVITFVNSAPGATFHGVKSLFLNQ
jgi:formamidopyrimidine-DNA glycosylase